MSDRAEAKKVDPLSRSMPGGGVRITDPNFNTGGGATFDPDMKFESRALAEKAAKQYGMYVVPDITLRNGTTLYRLSSVDPAAPPNRGTPMRPEPNWRGTPMRPDPRERRQWAENMGAEGRNGMQPVVPEYGARPQKKVQGPKQNGPDSNSDAQAQAREEAKRVKRLEAQARWDAEKAKWDSLGIEGVGAIARQAAAEGLKPGSPLVRQRIMESPSYMEKYGNLNNARLKAGLPALDPETIQGERQTYKTLMRRAGVPEGFYDQDSDFDQFLTNDISPDEVASRLNLANEVVGESVSPEMAEAFKRYYGIKKGDLVAYYLDPDRAEPLLQKQAQAAILGGVAKQEDLGVNRNLAEKMVERGIDEGQARAAAKDSAEVAPVWDTLAGLDGQGDISRKQVFKGNLGMADGVLQKGRALASRERARFSGSADASRSFGADRGDF